MITAFRINVKSEEHQRLRKIMCSFLTTALLRLRDEYGMGYPSIYKSDYKAVASQLSADTATELHSIWEVTLLRSSAVTSLPLT